MAWARVQEKMTFLGSVSSGTATFTNNTVAGNRAICFVGSWNSVSPAPVINSVSDAKNGSWHKDAELSTFTDGTERGEISVWSVQIATQLLSSDNVTITASATMSQCRVSLHEYSGLDTSAAAAVDVSATNSSGGTGTTAWASGTTATTNASSELMLTIYSDTGNSPTWSPAPSGWTARINVMGDATLSYWVGDKDSGATGTKNATGTLSAAVNWGGMIAVYKLAGGVTDPYPLAYLPLQQVSPTVWRM